MEKLKSKFTCKSLGIIIYVILGFYLLYVNYQSPYVEVHLEQNENKWVIKSFENPSWADKQGLTVGDTVLQVDGTDIDKLPRITENEEIISANHLTVQHDNQPSVEIKVLHQDLQEQFILQIVFPAIYFVLSGVLAIYLMSIQVKRMLNLLLIFFLLTVSLAYISSGASARYNVIGLTVNSSCLVLCFVLLIHFLQHYYSYLKITISKKIHISWFYIMPLLTLLCNLISVVSPLFYDLTTLIILVSVLLLCFYITYFLWKGYSQSNSQKLRYILYGLLFPMAPFLVFYALPRLFFNSVILPAEIAILSILLIPFSFIFIQLSERLFDIQYHLGRARYYSTFAFIAAIIVSLLTLVWFDNYSHTKMLYVFSLVFVVVLLLLYTKERIDFHQRKILFTTHGDYIHALYTSINRIGQAYHIEQLLEYMKKEVKDRLALDTVSLDVNYDHQPESETIHLTLGELKKYESSYIMLLHDSPKLRVTLSIRHPKRKIHLKNEEIVWLELLALYFNIFMNNLKRIEDLIEEIEVMKTVRGQTVPWLDKLLWQKVEKEKMILAQELHDTILQEQLHIARQLDLLTSEQQVIKTVQVVDIREQLLEAILDLREYCEHLNPPLLGTLGLQSALLKLIQKVKMRADFLLDAQFDVVDFKDPLYHLMIYRLIQELLNNALKHSEAKNVSLKLYLLSNGFELLYEDDGKGCDQKAILNSSHSMGINGMRERVRAFQGEMLLETDIDQGMKISIRMHESREKYD